MDLAPENISAGIGFLCLSLQVTPVNMEVCHKINLTFAYEIGYWPSVFRFVDRRIIQEQIIVAFQVIVVYEVENEFQKVILTI